MNQKLLDLGIDPSLIRKNATTSLRSHHGTVWVKHYSLSIKTVLFNVVIVGSYSGLEMGEDGQRVLTLWEPVTECPEGFIDPLDIVKQIEQGVKEEDTRQKAEKKAVNEEVAREAQHFIEGLRASGTVNTVESPYLKRKKINTTKNIFVDQSGVLIIPMMAERGYIWNYQRITPEGDKYFLAGGRISGCYHVLQSGVSNTIFIGEGYVTCASVCLAFNEQGKRPMVVCAFNSGNMPHVCRAMRNLYPNKKIVILADNDQWKEKNTGILTAQKCGEAFVTPQFDLDDDRVKDTKPTDFNDLHCLESLGEVYRQVTSGITALVEASKKKAIAPTGEEETEISVANKLLAHFGDAILAHGDDLFLWDAENGYWNHLEKGNFQRILQIIVRIFGDKATDKKVKGAFNLFKIAIPQVDAAIFSQKKHLCNFRNGTLVFQDGLINFKPHDKRDLLTYSLPLLCPLNAADVSQDGGLLPPEGLFKTLVERTLQNDQEKITLLSQLYGALLFPMYPQIFFVIGEANTGKSTLAKIALNLVGIQNCSSVSPNRLFGFNLHQTMGKRVNYDLDIPTKFPLVDDTLKKVIDQVPIQIERKNRDAVQATLPPVHLYVGNELPNLGEGSAKPFERRVSFIRVNNQEVTAPIKDLHEQILHKELEHVVRFAIKGALSLAASKGVYVQNDTKKDALREWELVSTAENDFIELLKTDGVPVYDDDGKATGDRLFFGEGRTPRPVIATAAKRLYGQNIRKYTLFKELLKNGARQRLNNGKVCFEGIEVRPQDAGI